MTGSEPLPPERSARLLRALAADLEGMVAQGMADPLTVAGHLAVVAYALSDYISRTAWTADVQVETDTS